MKQPTKQTRSAAIRARKRTADDAHRVMRKYAPQEALNRPVKASAGQLRLTFLGGLNEVGEKNMAVIEYQNEAIVLDCGNNLGIDLPGVNYEINDFTYLETIKHKIKAYVITHGHLDHIGGLRHTVPRYPAPIYGSRYTVGVIARTFEDVAEGEAVFQPELHSVDIDRHEQLPIGRFTVEFIRVTHSLPDPAAICIETPVGRIVATGDFRLDPEPLDRLPTDTARLEQLGDQGVLLLMSDSSYADAPGRTPTEHTLQDSFTDIIAKAPGRLFVGVFSSNINRIQMIINAAAANGRKVALEGRSMLGFAEIAVRQGLLKIPKGTIVSIAAVADLPEREVLVMCTGGQGEPNAALGRMATGGHRHITLGRRDTVIISSTPIPGNEISYDQLSNLLAKTGVKLFRHPTHQLDGCGPLHVSGHARREELSEMIRMVRPTFFIPVHGGRLRRSYHADLGRQEGVAADHVLLPDNGDSLLFTGDAAKRAGRVPYGSLLVDANGSIVSDVVIKDRLMLSDQGIMTIVLTMDTSSGRLLGSPDVITRGCIAMKDSVPLMKTFRSELRRLTGQSTTKDVERLKAKVGDFTGHFIYQHTGRSPIVIPVVNMVSSRRPAASAPHAQ